MRIINYKSYKIILNIVLICLLIFIGNTYSLAQSVDWVNIKENSLVQIKEDENDIMANFTLAIAYANLGQVEEAHKSLQNLDKTTDKQDLNLVVKPYLELLKEKDDDLLLLNYAAFLASINKEHEQAVSYFNKIVELNPDNVWSRNYLAAAYIELEEYQKAEKVLDKALDIKKNNYSHLLLAVSYYRQGNYFRALRELTRAGSAIRSIFNL